MTSPTSSSLIARFSSPSHVVRGGPAPLCIERCVEVFDVVVRSGGLCFQIAWQVVVFQQDVVFQRLVPALDLALVIGWYGEPRTWFMSWRSSHFARSSECRTSRWARCGGNANLSRAVVARLDHDGSGILRRDAGGCLGSSRQARGLQYGPGFAVHGLGLHGALIRNKIAISMDGKGAGGTPSSSSGYGAASNL